MLGILERIGHNEIADSVCNFAGRKIVNTVGKITISCANASSAHPIGVAVQGLTADLVAPRPARDVGRMVATSADRHALQTPAAARGTSHE
jgi:hypothetical protein